MMLRWLSDCLRAARRNPQSDLRPSYNDDIDPMLRMVEPSVDEDKSNILAVLRWCGSAVLCPRVLLSDQAVRAIAELAHDDLVIVDEDERGWPIVAITRKGLDARLG